MKKGKKKKIFRERVREGKYIRRYEKRENVGRELRRRGRREIERGILVRLWKGKVEKDKGRKRSM